MKSCVGASSSYEFLIQLAGQYGIGQEEVREQLEYQIMTDFILSNTDRHLNNIGFLMDESLHIQKVAPIFDTGKSMFVDQNNYHDTEELLSIKVNSFASKEIKLLKLVQNKNVVDLTKIPTVSQIKKLYQKDEKIPDTFIKKVCNAYEKKIDLCRDFQLGKDLHKIKVAFQDKKYER